MPSERDDLFNALLDAVSDQLGELPTVTGRVVPAPERFSPYHEAAAVLATFELEKLRPARRDAASRDAVTAAREALRADSKLVTDALGRERWTLRTDVRREVLRSLGDRDGIERALSANRDASPGDDPAQEMFEAYVRGAAPPLDQQTARQLTGTSQVIEWLVGLNLAPALPGRQEFDRRAAQVALLQPFQELAGPSFAGRVNELAYIRDYIGVRPPGSVRERLLRVAATILNLREKPPLVIWGHGGLGKSTLISRVILEHATLPDAEQFPWGYLDFDRIALLAEEPLTLLIEAVRQLGIQYPAAAQFTESLRAAWVAELGDRPLAIKRAMSRRIDAEESKRLIESGDPINQERYLREFGALLRNLKVETAPFLLVLDTFERVQYRSEAVVLGICAFLERFQRHVPRLRTVIAGRAPLRNAPFPTQELRLGNFDEASAVGFLMKRGVHDKAAAARLYEQVGGNPLSLRLAAELFLREDFTRGGRSLFGFLLAENDVQAQLFARILNHIRDPDVRKLAYPGLVLRRVTPGIIRWVLAGPCDVDVPDDRTAQRLFGEMSREVGFVTVYENALVHRPDVRSVVLRMLREREPAKVRQIEEAAVEYYAARAELPDFGQLIERAEEIYHRLSLRQPLDTVRARWLSGVEPHLAGAVEELAARERAWLASRVGQTLTDEERAQADLDGWERDTFRRVRDLIQQRRLDDALAALHERSERRPGSTLYALEAELCEALKRWDNMRAIVARGIQSADEAGQRHEAIALRIWGARADIKTRALDEARQKLDEAERLLADDMTVRAVELLLHRLALVRAEHADDESVLDTPAATAPIVQQLLDRSKALTDAEVRQEPALMAWLAIEVGVDDLSVLQRIVRLNGVPNDNGFGVRFLAQTVATVDTMRSFAGRLADRAGAPPAASLTERWSQLMLSATPEALGNIVADLLPDVEAIGSVTAVLLVVLGRVAYPSFVPGDERAVDEERQQRVEGVASQTDTRDTRAESPVTKSVLGQKDPRSSSAGLRLRGVQIAQLRDALLSAFRSRQELDELLDLKLDRRLDAIAPIADLRSTVFQVIKAAEAEGWTADLVAAAREARPGNRQLQDFAAGFGLAATVPEPADLVSRIAEPTPFFDVTSWRERLGVVEGQVCRVELDRQPVGTGFLVGPDLVLTAFHVLDEIIDEKRPPAVASCRFDYKQLNDGATVDAGTSYELARDWLVSFSRSASYDGLTDPRSRHALGPDELTYALVRLARPAGADPIGGRRAAPNASSRRWIAMATQPAVQSGSQVMIVQHPAGRPLQVAFGTDARTGADAGGTRIFYNADTAPGSSGSPCFDLQWRLLAMHVASDREARVQVGISINAIVRHLDEVGLRYLLNQALP
jgi:cellulose synthase operon protein C